MQHDRNTFLQFLIHCVTKLHFTHTSKTQKWPGLCPETAVGLIPCPLTNYQLTRGFRLQHSLIEYSFKTPFTLCNRLYNRGIPTRLVQPAV
jgi:hypothetical protein